VSAEGLKLSVYFGERDRAGREMLSDALMDRIGEREVLASALLRGIEGFGVKHQRRTDRLLSLSEDLPLVVVAVDLAAPIARLAGEVAAIMPGGLLTLERVVLPGRQLGDDTLPGGDDDDDEVKLTLYCGRGERRGGQPIVGRALALLRAAGMPGATALTGLDGTVVGGRRRARFLSRNLGVPAIVMSVGPRAAVADVLPRLRALAGRHVSTLERVRVVRRDGRVLAELPALPAHDEEGLALWQRVTVVCGEGARWEDHPLHSRLVRRLREAGASGATALRGTAGFTDDGPPHGDRLTALRRRTPVLVTLIDSVPEVARLWPIVARATATTGLVTAEVVPAARARGEEGHEVGGLRLADRP
jgi:PII-like signaling protein